MGAEPYDKQEKRVAEYILEITKDGIGGGDDPVGFLIASHRYLLATARTRADEAVREIDRLVTGLGPHRFGNQVFVGKEFSVADVAAGLERIRAALRR